MVKLMATLKADGNRWKPIATLMIKTLSFLLITCLIIGCGGYKMQDLQIALEAGETEKAYTNLQKNAPKKPDIPFLFELGLVAHYANHFQESNAAFDQAGDIAEDRYTKSVSKEAASLVTSDQMRPYSGTRYERLLSHYYRAINYVYLNQLEGALVECRRATALINYFKGEDENYDFFGAGFLAHLSGVLFEATGEWNDAYISYKQAAEYYRNAAEKTGVEMPEDIGRSLVRLARKLGFVDELERHEEAYGKLSRRPENSGELILFYESGYVPPKGEDALTFPILKTDDVDDEKFMPTLMGRQGRVYKDIELEYLLRVAIPTLDSNRPVLSGIEVVVGDMKTRGMLVEDVENIAIETLNAQRTGILLRTLVRAVGKYLLYRKANKGHEALGLLVNLAGVVTEQADTRSWQTLPNQIFMVRMPLPAGTHTLNFSFLNATGRIGGRDSVPDIKIYPNRITFWNHRTYF